VNDRCAQCREDKQKRLTPLSVSARPASSGDWRMALSAVLSKWKGTPYVPGGSTPGVGTCCYGFVAGVLDELHGLVRPLAFMSSGLGVNNPVAATRAALELVRRYPSVEVQPHGYLPEPGDVLMIRVGAGIGHAGIIGVDTREFWHADRGAGVQYSGLGVWRQKVVRIYRSSERNRW
jgi:cell wall-associated NlpC family hydrolase